MPEQRSAQSDKAEAVALQLRNLPRPASGRSVLDALVHMIETSGLKVGDRLPPEVDLARRMNVSRPTIREALGAWQNMGIVVRNKGAGTRLAAEVFSNSLHVPLTLKLEAESLLRTHCVRRPLEIEASRLAAIHAGPAQRDQIVSRMLALIGVYEAGENWRAADAEFHAAIHDGSGNPLFSQLIAQIQRAFQDIYDAPLGRPHLGHATIPVHRDLAIAVAEGRSDDAAQITGRIMDEVEDEVRRVVKPDV